MGSTVTFPLLHVCLPLFLILPYQIKAKYPQNIYFFKSLMPFAERLQLMDKILHNILKLTEHKMKNKETSLYSSDYFFGDVPHHHRPQKNFAALWHRVYSKTKTRLQTWAMSIILPKGIPHLRFWWTWWRAPPTVLQETMSPTSVQLLRPQNMFQTIFALINGTTLLVRVPGNRWWWFSLGKGLGYHFTYKRGGHNPASEQCNIFKADVRPQ